MNAYLVPRHLDNDCPSAPPSSPPIKQPAGSSTKPIAAIFTRKRRVADESLNQPVALAHTQVDGQPLLKRARSDASAPTLDRRPTLPLAEQMRPRTLDDFVGQEELTGETALFRANLLKGTLGSVILWGPPGCGKTTLSRLIARESKANVKELSATAAGVAEVRDIIEEAKRALKYSKRRTLLFLDEIHRFNRAQQDVLLPHVEHGTIQLIGATTENPSFKVIAPLLSRCHVYTLQPLSEKQIREMLLRALARLDAGESASVDDSNRDKGPDEVICPGTLQVASPFTESSNVNDAVLSTIAGLAGGDGRTALSLLELAVASPTPDTETLVQSLKLSASTSYDRAGDPHYDTISALHKSVRSGDGNAAMFWLARMLTGGEDPLFIARRLVVMASEDIGLANDGALPMAIATLTACQTIGMPECRINLAHCVAYLAESPKSTRSYEAYNRAEAAAKEHTVLPIPLGMRNAPTRLMKALGYGEGYNYNPAFSHPVLNQCLPEGISNFRFLLPEGDKSDKEWNEKLLRQWELEENDGREWEGRTQHRRRSSQS